MSLRTRVLAATAVVATFTGCSGPVAGGPGSQAKNSASSRVRVVVVSVDGLSPRAYLDPDRHGLAVPTLRELRAGGAHSPGVVSVFPTVTYPSHTSMVTGVNPGRHGIVSNRSFDPLERNQGGWYWYAEDIRVPTLWQVAQRAGRRTALITWPVTVGARVDLLVPEYWRAGTPDDVKLTRAMSTPGIFEGVERRFPEFLEGFTPPDTLDHAIIDIAVHLVETTPPDLMLVHMWMVDEFQHRHGLWSAEGNARIEEADRQLGRLVAALEKTDRWPDTILVVISDHGFAAVETRMRPGVFLAQLGLVTPGEGGSLDDWKASARANSGSAYIYVEDPDDQVTRQLLVAEFGQLAGKPNSGLKAVLTADQIRARGGDPAAFLALQPAPGYAFTDGYTGPLYEPSSSKGTHGFDPSRPDMHASLLVYGPSVAPGVIDGARLIDLAPTIARWMALDLPDTEGKPLAIPRR